MSPRRGTVIAGGGTGGHIVPSLQIARAMVARGHAAETIELYGSRRGQEAITWPTLEFPHTLLPGSRHQAQPSAGRAGGQRRCGARARLGLRARHRFVPGARRPRVVVIVGGYASFPAGVAAVLTRVPLVSVTTDAVPGAVNGLLGRFAAANAVAFDGTDLPRAQVTGTPVLPELAHLDRSPAGRARSRAALGLPSDRQTVASMSGSLGARRVNRALAELAGLWAACATRALYHVTGRRDYDTFAAGAVTGADVASDGEGGGGATRRAGWSIASCRSRTMFPTSSPRRTCASPELVR